MSVANLRLVCAEKDKLIQQLRKALEEKDAQIRMLQEKVAVTTESRVVGDCKLVALSDGLAAENESLKRLLEEQKFVSTSFGSKYSFKCL